MNAIRWLLLICLLAGPLGALSGAPGVAYADDEAPPWGEVFNPDGSIRWETLNDLGVITVDAGWMDVVLPGGMLIDLDATFHRYVTASGHIVVLPSPVTLFFMALRPSESGLNNAHSLFGDGASLLALLVGPTLSPEQLAQIAALGYVEPSQFFQAVIDGLENIWSIVNFTYLAEMLRISFESGFWVHAFLLYVNGLAECEHVPGGCPELEDCPPGGCPPATPFCPAPSITQQPATLAIRKVAPENPLVVGQDPERRGADIQLTASIPPVIFTWYEQIEEPPECHYSPTGSGRGCPGPPGRYGRVQDAGGNRIPWSSDMVDNPSWIVVEGEILCIPHVEIVPELVSFVQASAVLNPASRAWILNDLATRYYEANIHQERFNLVPGLGQPSLGCGSDGVCMASAFVPGVPFADPGTFDLQVWVHTQGAVLNWNGTPFPLTGPRVLYQQGELQVYVTLVTLIPLP
jgi:hypothetical protein